MTGGRAHVALAAGLMLILLPGTAAGQSNPTLAQAFGRFLQTDDMQIDMVPDLYEGGYARISVHAKNANLGGMLVDEVWFKLVGVTLDTSALQRGSLKILDSRGTAFYTRIGVQRLQEYFLGLNAFQDIRLWSDGTSIYGEGTVPYRSVPLKVWLKGRFSINGNQGIYFHVDNMRVNGFPLFSPIIRMMEAQINPVMNQRGWPVTFMIRSLQMTTDGFVLSSQADALAPCVICAEFDAAVQATAP